MRRWRHGGVSAIEEEILVTQSFDDFYREHHAEAVRWATALVGRRDVAEDLAQDALERTGRRLSELEESAAYLRRSVVNACRSWHRSHRRELRRMRLAAPTDEASGPIEVSAPSREVLAAVQMLPYPQRAAVVLRFWADWSDVDIATSLGCKPASVRVLVHRGIARLREELTT